MTRPTHRQLEYLVAVGDTGHFGHAAQLCHVSQPTLSAQLQLLEGRLGAQLINRSPRGAEPTALGQQVIELSREVLSKLTEIQDAANRANKAAAQIRLGLPSSFGPYFLTHLMCQLDVCKAEIDVKVREAPIPELIDLLMSDRLDCCVMPPMDLPGLKQRNLLREELKLGLPSTHPLATNTEIRSDMLAGEPLLLMVSEEQLCQLNHEVYAFCQASGVAISYDYQGSSLDGIRHLVSIGKGLSLFPEFYANSECLHSQDISLRPITDQSLTRELCFSWRKGTAKAASNKHLFDTCQSAIHSARQ